MDENWKVDKQILERMVREIGVKHFISNNFGLQETLVSILGEEIQTKIDDYILSVDHIAIASANTFVTNDIEVMDAYRLYASKPSRQKHGNFILIPDDKLYDFVIKWGDLRKNINTPASLIIIGQARAGDITQTMSEDFGGIDANTIAQIIDELPAVNSITLLGCHTAVSRILSKEDEAISSFLENDKKSDINLFLEKTNNESQFLFLLLSDENFLSDNQVNSTVVNNSLNKYNKDHYILNKEGDKYTLYYFLAGQNIPAAKIPNLNDNQIEKIAKFFNKNKLSFPKNDKVMNVLMDSKIIKEISINDIVKPLESEKILIQSTKSKKELSRASILIEADELAQLEKTWLKKVIKFIEKKIDKGEMKNRKFDIEIKGYTGFLHVDAQNKKMLVSHGHRPVYRDASYRMSFLRKENNSIDVQKLEKEQSESIKNIKNNKLSSESQVKSIKYHIKFNK